MFFNSNAFRITAFIFILVTALITLIKPPIFFNKEGELKSFDVTYTDETTPVTFGIFIYGFLVTIYIIVIFIDVRIGQLLATAGPEIIKPLV